jgi:hypothetical protein
MADGGAVIQGSPGWLGNTSQTPNQLDNGATSGDGTGLYLFGGGTYGPTLYAVASGAPREGVRAYSYQGDGVNGIALPYGQNGVGVRGPSLAPDGVGVLGFHPQRTGVWGSGSIGVVGQSSHDFGIGVEGDASGQGAIGVFGAASGSRGIGVYATAPSPDSAALQVNGRAVFSQSGRIVVPAGATSATQSGLSLSTAAFVVATLQQNLPGVAVRAAIPDPVAGTVTVFLTGAPSVDATVGWMAVN